jgi:type II secretory ATPase GspE/PulE/Tfp pilus assembly ATPase PilB-like protein
MLKIVARIKVLADLVVYRKDVPQDGRIDAEKTSSGRPMRISAVPTVKGEKIVIRLLGDRQEIYRLDTLGFQEKVVRRAARAGGRARRGMLLLTGPSSSGKTTTIYALILRDDDAPEEHDQHRDDRGPGRVHDGQDLADPGEPARGLHVCECACARSCGRIPR